MIYSEKSMQNQLEEVIREKKRKILRIQIVATRIVTQETTPEKHKGNTQTAQQSL